MWLKFSMHCLCCKFMKIMVLKNMCLFFNTTKNSYFYFLIEQGSVCFPLGSHILWYCNISNSKVVIWKDLGHFPIIVFTETVWVFKIDQSLKIKQLTHWKFFLLGQILKFHTYLEPQLHSNLKLLIFLNKVISMSCLGGRDSCKEERKRKQFEKWTWVSFPLQ